VLRAKVSFVTERTELRIWILVPLLFLVLGGAILWVFHGFRAYISPTTGYVSGAVVIVLALATIQRLWTGARSAWAVILIAGLAALLGVVVPTQGIDLVNASSEPPTFLALYWWYGLLALILLLTICASARTWWLASHRRAE
jgi:hypothetical protein